MAITRATAGNTGDLGWLPQDDPFNQNGGDLPWITYLDGAVQYYGEDAEQPFFDDPVNTDDDTWVSTESQSGPVGPDAPAPTPLQFYGDDAETTLDGNQDHEQAVIPAGYQQADLQPQIEDGWDWLSQDDDEQWCVDESQLVDLPSTTAQAFDDPWDHWPPEEDEYAASDDYENDVGICVEDAWDHWLTDDDDQPLADDYQQPPPIAAPLQYFGEDAEQWAEDLDFTFVGGSYQQVDVQPQIEDAWDHFVTDDDDQVLADDYSLASVVVAVTQYFGEDAELLDQEDDDQVILPDEPRDGVAVYYGEDAELHDDDDDDQVNVDAYALVDNNPVITIEDAWDWFPAEDDEQAPLDEPPQPVVAVAQGQFFGDEAELLFEDLDFTFVGGSYQQTDVQPQIEDPWQHWDFEQADDDYPLDDYALISVVVATTQYYGEDAELADQDDDDWAWSLNEPTDSLAAYYGEDAELTDQDDDDQISVDAYALIDNNPVICLEDAWDHWPTEDDDYSVSEDYAGIGDTLPQYYGQDAELADQDDDEQAPLDDVPLINFVSSAAQYFGEDAELLDQDDDEQWCVDEANAQNASLAQTFDDPWDYFTTDDDEYAVSDDYSPLGVTQYYGDDAEHLAQEDDDQAILPNDPTDGLAVIEDAWDHFAQDEDDYAVSDDVQPVAPQPLQYYGEQAEQLDQDDDEQWCVDEAANVALLQAPVITAEDAWDWFPAEDDDYYVADDYAIVEIPPTPLYLYGNAFCWSLGTGLLVQARRYRTPDPRRYNASNAWLGYRGAGGHGIY